MAWAAGDPVAQLSRRIEAGEVKVRFDEKRGYLPWLLEALEIPAESQMLVFSKTSVQALRISPGNPRTLYFNDSVIVGSVKGGPVELVAQDPEGGIAFYLADQSPFRYRELMARDKPASPIAPRRDCPTCHISKATGLAQTLIRSVTADASGVPLPGFPVRDTDSRTPFEQLWGGWYVTGSSTGRHSGNTVRDAQGKPVQLNPPGSSDVVALMVFEHQMRVMNLIANREPRALADALLFEGEAPLPEKVAGASGFAEAFMARGPRDGRGRSLRDLDLRRRLMRYRCSYMIYSPAFDALPADVKAAVYRRMWEVLSARADEESRAVVGILRDTKPDLPAYYSPDGQ
jgi:hypothetical protein